MISLIEGEVFKPGKYVETINLNKKEINDGIYFFKLKIDGNTTIKKIIYLK